jgi:ADP-ribosylglycohydrolase
MECKNMTLNGFYSKDKSDDEQHNDEISFIGNFLRTNNNSLKCSFILSFYCLIKYAGFNHQGQNTQSFYTSLKNVISQSGDVSSNATIIGGMIGAYVGVSNIPKYMIDSLLTFDC